MNVRNKWSARLSNFFIKNKERCNKIIIRYGKTRVFLALFACILIALFFIRGLNDNSLDEEPITQEVRTVTLISSENFQSTSSGRILGTAEAKTEATLQSERGGRVTSVSVVLGQTVSAGTIIAQFENALERAAVTQARGAYEAALAAASQGTINISDANSAVQNFRNGMATSHNSAYTTVFAIVTGSLDRFYANPNSSLPTLRIGSGRNTSTLSNNRVQLQSDLNAWQERTVTLRSTDDLRAAQRDATEVINRTIATLDIFIDIFQVASGDTLYTEAEYRQLAIELSGTRSSLTALIDTFKGLELQLTQAEENVRRAEIGSGQGNSLANAQITQARGGLQAAEANLAKTIIRAPISGTITALSVKTGDFVGAFTPLAQITNTSGIEIVTFVNEAELDFFTPGAVVLINDDISATVTNVSPTINPNTRKFEIRLGVNNSDIRSGDTVTITTSYSTQNQTSLSIIVPLSAVRYLNGLPHIFQVEDNILLATPVTLGRVRGDQVTIEDGISLQTRFVRDARGLTAGNQVTIQE